MLLTLFLLGLLCTAGWTGSLLVGHFVDCGPELHRIGLAVRRWRRVLEEYAEEQVRAVGELTGVTPPDPEAVAALVATALLGGRRAKTAGEHLAERIGAQGALRLRDRGGRLLTEYVDGVLGTERERRLAPMDALGVGPEPQAELIAALSLLQKER